MLGEVLRAWRIRHGIGIREAARIMGISAATLSRVENNAHYDAITLVKIWDWLLHDPPNHPITAGID